MPYETTLFNLLAAAALLGFAVGVIVRVRRWPQRRGLMHEAGRTPNLPHLTPSLPQRVRALLAAFASHVLAFKGGAAARGPLAWAAHVILVWGTILLATVCIIANLSHIFGSVYYRPDTAPYAVAGDLGGLMLILGSTLLIARRVRAKRAGRPQTDLQDVMAAALILVLVLSGEVVESFRLLSEPTHRAEHVWSFIGAPIATAIRTPHMDWYRAWLVAWWVHVGLALGFLVYAPHARLFRHFAQPLADAVRTAGREGPARHTASA